MKAAARTGFHTDHPEGDETLVVQRTRSATTPNPAPEPAAGALRFNGSDFEGFDGVTALAQPRWRCPCRLLVAPDDANTGVLTTQPGAVPSAAAAPQK